MEPVKVGIEAVFRKYTRLPRDRQCFLLDVRDHKSFKRHHLLLSYCVRLSSDGRALLDYSKNAYDTRWSQQVWWGADVIVLGSAGLKKDHAAIRHLVKEGRAASVSYLKDGIEAFEKVYPFLVGQSLKAHRALVYPSPVVPRQLYVGSWADASDAEKLAHLNVSRVITLHNEPRNLKLPNTCKQMAITAADLATTDLTPYFNPTFVFIEESVAAKRTVLVHCGAGSSRSATICAAYLMRKQRISAHAALTQLHRLRSTVCPNEGFWRQLCAFEKELGLVPGQQSNIDKPPIVNESYGQAIKAHATEGAAGSKVDVKVSKTQRDAGEQRPDKRSRDQDCGGAGTGDPDKRARAADSGDVFAGASKVTASMEVEITKDGTAVGSLKLPTLRPHQRCKFGRGDNVDVKLEHASLSRHHAELAVTLNGTVTLTDLGSSHGTNVDGVWVKAQEPKLLKIGTRFRFAASSRTYIVRQLVVHQ